MAQITIDGKVIEIEEGYSLIQACELAGVEIPRFCYHERLKIAGNCRMCLVEVEKAPKLVASCAMPVTNGMVVHTNSPKVKQAREGVMEFLLINHPLDCPICDQGGECDLQDQAFKYGKNFTRFAENKRSVKDKYMGPLISTHMTRCIHCTRCIRFASDVAGVEEIGTLGRGEDMEISTYLEKSLTSELSGNLSDLCPVGALTAKPYEFRYRNWELTKTRSIDVFDGMGSNVRIDTKGFEVIRILPEINDNINQEWISDKGRFSHDGLKYQRLARPYLRIDDKLQEVSWRVALKEAAKKLRSTPANKIAAICGQMLDCETIFAFKELINSLGCDNLASNQFGYRCDVNARANYLFNTTISGVDKYDFCLLVGSNPRHDAPVLNARIGMGVRERKAIVARIGVCDEQTYKINELGDDLNILQQILDRQHPICQQLEQSSYPMIILGMDALLRADSLVIQNMVHNIADKYGLIRDDWCGVNILHRDAGAVGLLDLKFMPKNGGKDISEIFDAIKAKEIELVYLLAADELNMQNLDKAFVIYQGHHGDAGANRADLVLPGCAYTEKLGTYINIEGRSQVSRAVSLPPGQARDDREILLDLAKELSITLPFLDLASLRELMHQKHPAIAQIGQITPAKLNIATAAGNLLPQPLSKTYRNYYFDNAISRASPTMLACSKFILNQG